MNIYKQPTEAEINEAAEALLRIELFDTDRPFKSGFNLGVSWLQDYQSRDNSEKDKCSCGQCDKCFYNANKKWYEAQQPVKQVRSLEQILKEHGVIEYDVRTNAAIHEYTSQFQTPAIGFDASLIEEMRPGDAYAEPQPNAISVIEEDDLKQAIEKTIGYDGRSAAIYNFIEVKNIVNYLLTKLKKQP